MQIRMKHTIRTVLAATVACGLLVSACASKDAKMQQSRADMSGLRAPEKNPGMKASIAAKMQEDELVQVVSENEVAYEAEEVELASSGASYQPAPQPQKGWFNWGAAENAAPSAHTQMERKVPMLNANPSADYQAMGQAAAVTDVVVEETIAAPYASEVIVAEEVAMFQEYVQPAVPKAQAAPQYPNLASVPVRPERLDAVQDADARMAQLHQEQQQSQQQVAALEQQMQADAGGSMLPSRAVPAASAGHYGDNGLNHGKEVVIIEEAQAVQYAGDEPVSFDVVESAKAELPSGQPWTPPAAAPAVLEEEVFAVAAPAEPVIVEEMVTTQAPVAPQTEEWVSLQADPAEQMAQPMEQVAVAQAPDVAHVSDAVSPQAIQLTPPSVGVREQRASLPESRYAARRQAVYAQRYNRVQLVDSQ